MLSHDLDELLIRDTPSQGVFTASENLILSGALMDYTALPVRGV